MQFWNHTSRMERVESPDEPWRYGDEASLYSIAEDSREDRISVSASGALGASSGAFDAQEASSNAPSTVAPGVELCIADEDERTRSSSDEIFYYQQPHGNRRLQWFGLACIVCTLMGGVVASVLFTQFNREASQSRSSSTTFKATPGEEENEEDNGETEIAADEADSRFAMAETHVLNALNQCQWTQEAAMTNPGTPQGRIYDLLVQEVFDGAIIDNFGMVIFADLHGEEFLRERYALEMLYDSTNGENWNRSGGWEIGSTASDPCSWWGIACESPRIQGTCAVTGVALDDNNLSGELPQEFCCLPCAKSISMADNSIGGPILTCLSSIPHLNQVDFKNNAFDSFGDMADAQQPLSTSP